MRIDNKESRFIVYLESRANEQKVNFADTSCYLSKMVFCDSEDCQMIAKILRTSEGCICQEKVDTKKA